MKSKTFLAALVCCLCLGFATEAAAASWRVNNDKRANANFLDLNAAMGNVSNGDTLYVDKATTFSSIQYMTKTVTVIGPGYFIGENDADEAYFSNTVYIQAEGVKLTGLHLSNVTIRHNKAIIERCRVTGNITATETNYDADDCSIRSCFIKGCIMGQGQDGTDGWNILNNIFYLSFNGNLINNFYNVLIDHNTFNMQFYNYYPTAIGDQIWSSTITNNIAYQGYTKRFSFYCGNPTSDNTIEHNVMNTSMEYSANHPNNTIDEEFQLDSFFTGTGGNQERDAFYESNYEGSDAGAFSGAYPYVMNGYPLYVPRFESVNVPSQPDANGNLRVNLVIKNQNK
jgi:hypothetical protein